jgi:hypothetical protein
MHENARLILALSYEQISCAVLSGNAMPAPDFIRFLCRIPGVKNMHHPTSEDTYEKLPEHFYNSEMTKGCRTVSQG